ncbi:MAG TPA: hypothetical protein DD670_14120, partial [Planctomycetaceae bacterium]|nr:hypothetical protein [Planctomycetaceae bacterium]
MVGFARSWRATEPPRRTWSGLRSVTRISARCVVSGNCWRWRVLQKRCFAGCENRFRLLAPSYRWCRRCPSGARSIENGESWSMNPNNSIRYHDDAALFREALTFTESTTRFSARLVEKDYFCSVLLKELFAFDPSSLVFKGGTCLSKVHAEFYRLSEDLDFAISVPTEMPRRARSKSVEPVKRRLAGLDRRIPHFRVLDALRGYNNSTQYVARLGYRSLVTGQEETIKVEISVREPILDPVERLPACTLLIDPFRRVRAVGPFPVGCISCREAYAEKLRAALSRRDPAIRDFFDL